MLGLSLVVAVVGCFADSLPPPTAHFSEGIEIETPMTDSHIRLLAAVARYRERERDEHRSSADPSALREADLSHRASRAREQMSAARTRRPLATGVEPNA
jgi:hypothetical protein